MSHIKFQLGTDNAPFKQGLASAESEARSSTSRIGRAFDEMGKDISRKLNRAFGAGDVFKGLLQGIGIGSVEKVAELLAKGFERAADAAKEIATFTEKSLSATLKLIDLRQTDAQRLDTMNREQARTFKELNNAKNDLSFGLGNPDELQKRVGELTVDVSERAVKIAEFQKKIDEDAKKRTEDLAKAKATLAKATLDAQREEMTDAQRLASLDAERAKYGLDSLDSRKSELEKTEALTKEQEAQRAIVTLKRKIQDDAAAAQKKEADELERARKEAERLAEKISEVNDKLTDSAKKIGKAKEDLSNAQFDPFRFSLADAAGNRRGSARSQASARLIQTKEGQAQTILDRNNLEFDDSGRLRYIPAPNESAQSIRDRQSIAETQTLPRLNALMGGAANLRRSTANLDRKEQDPTKAQRMALRDALDESKTLAAMKKSLEGKFKNQ